MKSRKIKIKNTSIKIEDLKTILEKCPEVAAAYLFGSAASGAKVVNDLDVLVLLHKSTDKSEAHITIFSSLSHFLEVPEAYIDLLFFDLTEAEPSVLTRAVNQGILLVNNDPEYLGNTIDNVSRYLLDNEVMMANARRLRQERVEVFGAT